MEGIRCHIKKGTEFTFGYDRYYAKKDYYTIVKPKDFGNLAEIARKAKRNICKQIAQDFNKPNHWQSVEFYDRDIEMEYYNSDTTNG